MGQELIKEVLGRKATRPRCEHSVRPKGKCHVHAKFQLENK